jgi:formylmethanofuran dehydrogenase subunit E
MVYPDFFDKIETIKLQDPLSAFLGTFEKGVVEFTYLDVVKSAGHSCPTVAGAYLSTQFGLKALYGEELPQRGNIRVEFKESVTDGVAGVIASVITNITGATTDFGFKGIGGNFNRTNLMFFNQDINSSVRFTRLDSGKAVDVLYNPNGIKPLPQQMELMQRIMQGVASDEERVEFGKAWQDRVRRIFENSASVIELF